MNRVHVLAAIHVMERVRDDKRPLNMAAWQKIDWSDPIIASTEEEAVACGSVCCFGGWLALSPEWLQAGGSSSSGMPFIDGVLGAQAVAAFLDIDQKSADILTATSENQIFDTYVLEPGYRKQLVYITAQDVIDQLHKLLKHGRLTYT